MMMTLRRRSARTIMFLQAVFILAAFLLLSLRNEEFDMVAVVMGVGLMLFNIIQFSTLKIAFVHIERFTLLAAQFLWSLGLIVLYRISADIAIKQFIFLFVGSFAMIIVMLVIRKSRNFGKWNWFFMGATLVLLLSTLIFAQVQGGARNWLNIAGFSLQPSEFAKLLFIMVSAFFLSTREKLSSFIPYILFAGACVIMLVASRDLGAGLLISGTFLLMFFAATGRTLLTLLGLGVFGVGAYASYKVFPHVRSRVQIWQDPWASYHEQGGGFQVVQGLIALASGGLLGTGLGRGMPSAIPVSSSDYIFAVIGEEFGIIFGIFVIIFYLVFIVRGILIALNAEETYDAILVFGCTAMFSLQSFIIIGGVIKLIPLTGITLPFISAGGSSLLASMMQLGMIQGVALKNGRKEDEELAMMGVDIR